MVRDTERVKLENVKSPRESWDVDAGIYEAMKQAILKILPNKPPGLTVGENAERRPCLSARSAVPGRREAGGRAEAVQFDLEAKGVVIREKVAPLGSIGVNV